MREVKSLVGKKVTIQTKDGEYTGTVATVNFAEESTAVYIKFTNHQEVTISLGYYSKLTREN